MLSEHRDVILRFKRPNPAEKRVLNRARNQIRAPNPTIAAMDGASSMNRVPNNAGTNTVPLKPRISKLRGRSLPGAHRFIDRKHHEVPRPKPKANDTRSHVAAATRVVNGAIADKDADDTRSAESVRRTRCS